MKKIIELFYVSKKKYNDEIKWRDDRISDLITFILDKKSDERVRDAVDLIQAATWEEACEAMAHWSIELGMMNPGDEIPKGPVNPYERK